MKSDEYQAIFGAGTTPPNTNLTAGMIAFQG